MCGSIPTAVVACLYPLLQGVGDGWVRRAVSTQAAKFTLEKHFREITPSQPCAGNESGHTQGSLRAQCFCYVAKSETGLRTAISRCSSKPNHLYSILRP